MGVKKGNIPWNKGLKGICSKETIQKMREKAKLRVGEKNSMYGKHHSEKAKIQMGNSRIKGIEEDRIKPWNKGKVGLQISPMKGKHHTIEAKKSMGLSHMGNKSCVGRKLSKKTIIKRERTRQKNGWWKNVEETKLKMSAISQGISIEKWDKFVSREPYDQNWNNKFKRAIRKRDNQICMLCGIHREKLKRALCVHHVNYDKLMSIPQNCVSLCTSCHMKTNFDRKIWQRHFQSLLNKRYDYKYSENQEIKLNLNQGVF